MPHQAGVDFFKVKRSWSRYKDSILAYYLKPYLAKVRKLDRPILLVDLFAGPGKFEDGEPGSPLIMLEAAEPLAVAGHPIRVLLVERDPDLVARLRKNTAPYEGLADVRHADSLDLMEEIAAAAATSTVFLYVDPFTIGRLHLDRLAAVYSKIRDGSSVELLFVFMVPIFLRWARACLEAEESSQDALGDRLVVDEAGNFDSMMAYALWDAPVVRALKRARTSGEELDAIAGGTYWRDYVEQPLTPEVYLAFARRYCDVLRGWFPTVCMFPVYATDSARIPKYWLIFGTRYRPALDLINRATAEARAREFKTWGDGTLFAGMGVQLPTQPDLRRLIAEQLRGTARTEWRELRWQISEQELGWFTDSAINDGIKRLLSEGRLRGALGKKVEERAVLEWVV